MPALFATAAARHFASERISASFTESIERFCTSADLNSFIALDEISAVINLSFVMAHGEQTGIKKQQVVRHCFSSIGPG
jgi:hypothetical protein